MASELGDFLRAARARVTPEQAGVHDHGTRRVPGLRREEVALLAGVSVDYYTRLEQGRERHPSTQVLDVLTVVLRMDADARAHAFRIAGVSAPPREGPSGVVAPELVDLMATWPDSPAMIFDRAYDVLASNVMADALFCRWRHSRNLLGIVFTDPDARTFYRDWHEVAADAVAGFRLNHGHDPGHPRVQEVLTDMLATSPAFAELWQTHRVRGKSLQRKRFHHPEVGDLELTMQAFDVRSGAGQELVVYHAAAGSDSARALALLGSLAATNAE